MKVTLVSHTEMPMDAICMAIATMKSKNPAKYVQSLPCLKKMELIDEILKTRLRGALEFASFEFLIEGVTRAFTHQLVRHRTFHFSQQSMRFFNAESSGFRFPSAKDSYCEFLIEEAYRLSFKNYQELLKHKYPIEDARSILPTNVLTKIMFGCTFRGLVDLAEVRLCLQTQSEFREVMVAIKEEVKKKVSPFLASKLEIVCQRTGHCEFDSVFDRPCPLKSKLKGKETKNASEKSKRETSKDSGQQEFPFVQNLDRR